MQYGQWIVHRRLHVTAGTMSPTRVINSSAQRTELHTC